MSENGQTTCGFCTACKRRDCIDALTMPMLVTRKRRDQRLRVALQSNEKK